MRISDWSSDVCSSDLIYCLVMVAQCGQRAAVQEHKLDVCAQGVLLFELCRSFLDDFQGFLVLTLGQQLAATVGHLRGRKGNLGVYAKIGSESSRERVGTYV